MVGGGGSNTDSGGVCSDSNGGAVRCGNKIDGAGGAGSNGSGGGGHECSSGVVGSGAVFVFVVVVEGEMWE